MSKARSNARQSTMPETEKRRGVLDVFGKKKRTRQSSLPTSDLTSSTQGGNKFPKKHGGSGGGSRDRTRTNPSPPGSPTSSMNLGRSDTTSVSGVSARSYGMTSQLKPYSDMTMNLYEATPYNDPWGNHLIFNRFDNKRHVIKHRRSGKSKDGLENESLKSGNKSINNSRKSSASSTQLIHRESDGTARAKSIGGQSLSTAQRAHVKEQKTTSKSVHRMNELHNRNMPRGPGHAKENTIPTGQVISEHSTVTRDERGVPSGLLHPDSGYSSSTYFRESKLINGSHPTDHTVRQDTRETNMGNRASKRESYDVNDSVTPPPNSAQVNMGTPIADSNGVAIVLDTSKIMSKFKNSNQNVKTTEMISETSAIRSDNRPPAVITRSSNAVVNSGMLINTTDTQETQGRRPSLKSYPAPPVPANFTSPSRDGSVVHSAGGLSVRTLNTTGDSLNDSFTQAGGWSTPSRGSSIQNHNVYSEVRRTNTPSFSNHSVTYTTDESPFQRQGSIHERVNKVANADLAVITRNMSVKAGNVEIVKDLDVVDSGRPSNVQTSSVRTSSWNRQTGSLPSPDRYNIHGPQSPISGYSSSRSVYSSDSDMSMMADGQPPRRTLTVQAKLPFNDADVRNSINRVETTRTYDARYPGVQKVTSSVHDPNMQNTVNSTRRVTTTRTQDVRTQPKYHHVRDIEPLNSTSNEYSYVKRIGTQVLPTKHVQHVTTIQNNTGNSQYITDNKMHVIPSSATHTTVHSANRNKPSRNGPHKTSIYLTSDGESEADSVDSHPTHVHNPINPNVARDLRSGPHKTTILLKDKEIAKSKPRERRDAKTVIRVNGPREISKKTRVYSASDEDSGTEHKYVTEESRKETVFYLNGTSELRQSPPALDETDSSYKKKSYKVRQEGDWFSDSSNEFKERPPKQSTHERNVEVLRYTTKADDKRRDVTASPERHNRSSQKFTNESTIVLHSPHHRSSPTKKSKKNMGDSEVVDVTSTTIHIDNEILGEEGHHVDENQNTKSPDDLQVKRKEVLISNYIDTTGPRIVDIEADENVNMFERSYFTSHENPLYHSDDEHHEPEETKLSGKSFTSKLSPLLLTKSNNYHSKGSYGYTSRSYDRNTTETSYTSYHKSIPLTHSRACQTPRDMFVTSLLPGHMRTPWMDETPNTPYSVRKIGHTVFKSATKSSHSTEPLPNMSHAECQTEDINMFHGAFLSDTLSRPLFSGKLMRTDSMSSVASVNDLYRDAKTESYRYETGFRRPAPQSATLTDLQRRKQQVQREQQMAERKRILERSVKTKIHVDHDEENVENGSPEEMDLLDQDNITENVELGIVGNMAQVRVKVVAERLVPLVRGSNQLKKSIVTVTKVTEIDMNAMPETRALFDKIQNSPGIARRMVNNKTDISSNEQTLDGRDVYRIYNALARIQEEAEQLNKVRPSKVVVSGTTNDSLFANANLELPKWGLLSSSVPASDDEDGNSSTAGSILY